MKCWYFVQFVVEHQPTDHTPSENDALPFVVPFFGGRDVLAADVGLLETVTLSDSHETPVWGELHVPFAIHFASSTFLVTTIELSIG